MEDTTLAEKTNDKQSSYSLIVFSGQGLPAQYHNLILSKWLRSLKFGNDYFRLIDNDAYFKTYGLFIKSILARLNCVVKLSVLSDDHDIVLGFCVYEGSAVHYVHVHKDYRRIGVGSALLPKEFLYITHLTKQALQIWNKYPDVKFNPFI